MLIAGDIGGTKTSLAIFDPAGDAHVPVVQMEYRSGSYAALDVMVREFLRDTQLAAEVACFAVAGPVIGKRAQLTNLPWTVDLDTLRISLGLKQISLINDLKATAYAIPRLQDSELHTINAGKQERNGTIAVIAPGTGLGEAFLIWSGRGYLACSSEGGHASFAPTDSRQLALWEYLHRKFGHVSAERVCSGKGIANIYDFLRESDPSTEPASFAAQLALAADRTPLIVQAGLSGPDANPIAADAVDMFVAVLAGEAGNLALKALSTGGIYLAGGIPRRVLVKLTDGQFMRAFTNKGRFEEMMTRLPVHVVLTQAALLGAALHGMDLLRVHSTSHRIAAKLK